MTRWMSDCEATGESPVECKNDPVAINIATTAAQDYADCMKMVAHPYNRINFIFPNPGFMTDFTLTNSQFSNITGSAVITNSNWTASGNTCNNVVQNCFVNNSAGNLKSRRQHNRKYGRILPERRSRYDAV